MFHFKKSLEYPCNLCSWSYFDNAAPLFAPFPIDKFAPPLQPLENLSAKQVERVSLKEVYCLHY